MPVYRVTLQTSVLVDAENEEEASRLGHRHLEDEIRSGTESEVYRVEHLEWVYELRRGERGTLPWRSSERNDAGEGLRSVEKLLKETDP